MYDTVYSCVLTMRGRRKYPFLLFSSNLACCLTVTVYETTKVSILKHIYLHRDRKKQPIASNFVKRCTSDCRICGNKLSATKKKTFLTLNVLVTKQIKVL